MKCAVVAIVLLGFVAGCAREQSAYPGASPRSYTTKAECESAGRTWDSIRGTCM
jgi:hypothetical protein